jgi:ribonuclease P/MRP protein subunit RPP1
MIISENNFDKARKRIKEEKQKSPNSEIIFSSSDDELSRKILEKEKIDILLLNQKENKDFQKQRNSGFNHVLAKLAKKSNVTIGINLDEIIESNANEKQKILARVKQNIKLCNKNKVQMKFIIQNPKNERNPYDLKSLGLVLGMPTWMTKNCA